MKRNNLRRLLLAAVGTTFALVAVAPQPAKAQSTDARTVSAAPSIGESVPRLVQFNGTLKDSAARAVSGVASVTFAIYAEQDGGAALWTETQNVLADTNGHYSALLGTASSGGFPAELIGTGQSRWLGVTMARQPEMARVLLAGVPYALKAGDADTLGGLPASSYVTTQQFASHTPASGNGTTIVPAPSGATAQTLPAANTSAAATDATQSVTQTTPTSSGTTNYIPLWTSSSNLGNSLLFQTGGKLGLGITTPASTLDINGGEILRGGFYEYPEDTATASNGGRPSHSFQWLASTYNSTTKAAVDYAFGFRAVPVNNNASFPGAKLDLFYGTGGPTGSIADTGLSIDSTGFVHFISGQIFSGEDEGLSGTLSVAGTIQSGSDIYATGFVDATQGFIVDSAASTAVGANTSGEVATAVAAYAGGTYGYGINTSGNDVGIYSRGGTYAGEFIGSVDVTGTLYKSSGAFKIDHPLDPANKYLVHSFVESPDMKNVYDGVVSTDANGFATVTMPDWFESLNRDFRYQLTTIGQPAQAWVATELANHAFAIRTDKPNVKVSWQITGIRQDEWANAHRLVVEQDKSDAEKGHYIHPELFGHPEDVSISTMRHGPDGKLVPIPEGKPAAQK
jgi:hypothetical protein